MNRCDRHGLFEHDGACPACEDPTLTVRPDSQVGGKLLRASLNDPIRPDMLGTLYDILEQRVDQGAIEEVFVTADTERDGVEGVNVLVYGDVTLKPVDNERAARNLIDELVADRPGAESDPTERLAD